MLEQLLQKLLMNAQNSISFTKLGGWIFALCEAIIHSPGAGIDLPTNIISIANIIVYFGAALGFSGLRDAFNKRQ